MYVNGALYIVLVFCYPNACGRYTTLDRREDDASNEALRFLQLFSRVSLVSTGYDSGKGLVWRAPCVRMSGNSLVRELGYSSAARRTAFLCAQHIMRTARLRLDREAPTSA